MAPALTVCVVVPVRASVGVDEMPLPPRLTIWLAGLVLSAIVMRAVRVPTAVGLKLILKVQEAPAAKVLGLTGQLLFWGKSPGLVPPTAMPVMSSAAVALVFFSVTTCAAVS